jgi:hypothetical protein
MFLTLHFPSVIIILKHFWDEIFHRSNLSDGTMKRTENLKETSPVMLNEATNRITVDTANFLIYVDLIMIV